MGRGALWFIRSLEKSLKQHLKSPRSEPRGFTLTMWFVIHNSATNFHFSALRLFFKHAHTLGTSREQPESLQPCYPEPRNQPLIGVLHSNCQLNCPKVQNGRSAEVMSFFANLCKHLSTLLVHRRPNQLTQKLESHKAKRDNFHHTMPTFAILKTVRDWIIFPLTFVACNFPEKTERNHIAWRNSKADLRKTLSITCLRKTWKWWE